MCISYLIIRKHVSRLIKEGLDNILFQKTPKKQTYVKLIDE